MKKFFLDFSSPMGVRLFGNHGDVWDVLETC